MADISANLSRYFRHRVEGLERVPVGAAILVSPHGLVPWDGILLGDVVFNRLGRRLHGMSHPYWFRVPGLRRVLARRGFSVGSREGARQLLRQGALLHTMPGGVPEAFRPSSKAYQIHWGRHLGYLRLAIEARVQIVPVATGGIDDLYHVTSHVWPGTHILFPGLKGGIPLAYGRGPLPWPLTLPRQMPLFTLVGAPITLPSSPSEDELTRLHSDIVGLTQELWGEARRRV